MLQQEDEQGRRHPSRYESGLWTEAETSYDAVTLECRGLLHALKKFRHYLYRVHFLVEIDAKTLVLQLNQLMTDMPGAVVGRWIAYIRLYSFDILHVPGSKHKGPDALSRRPASDEEMRKHRQDGDRLNRELEDEIDGALGCLAVGDVGYGKWQESGCGGFCTSVFHSVSVSNFSFLNESFPLAPTGYPVVSFVSFQRGLYGQEPGLVMVGDYLSTLRWPAEVSGRDFVGFKREATKFLLRDGILYRRGKAGIPPWRVIGNEREKTRIL